MRVRGGPIARAVEANTVREQFGEPVASVTTLNVRTGEMKILEGSSFDSATARTELHALLARIAKPRAA